LPACYFIDLTPHRRPETIWSQGDDAEDAADPIIRRASSEAGPVSTVEVLRDHPQLVSLGRLTLLQSLRCATLALWDEKQKRLISFRELRAGPHALPSQASHPSSWLPL
jgi:hypothetical protein